MADQFISALGVSDEPFLVASLIERCPKIMMVREIMMNALEAAQMGSADERTVEISTTEVNDALKLTFWNTGPGMNAHELLKISEIASSIGKEKSLNGNFGMGAKVASLPSNQYGMRYRSCKDGKVHEIILCKRGGIYGRLKRFSEDGNLSDEVIDVTEIVERDGRSLKADWTEVVLLGNRSEQSTVRDPYDGDPKQDVQWLANYLYHRFYRLPHGVKVSLLKGTHKLDGKRVFNPISSRLHMFERHQTVEVPGDIKIHYIYDAAYEKSTGTGHNKSMSGSVASDVSTCAVIYKNEMYDLRKGRAWSFDAPIFGITYGARHISIHVELPDRYPIVPDAYRQFLRYENGEQAHLIATDFSAIVRENRPEWLLDLIKKFAPDSASSDDIREELQSLLNSLRVKRVGPKMNIDGSINVGTSPGRGADTSQVESTGGAGDAKPRDRPTDLSALPTGAKRAELFNNLERAPEIITLYEDLEIEEKGIRGRAARYLSEPSQLFINMKYYAILEMQNQLEKEYPDAPDVEIMRTLAKQQSEKSMILRVGRTVVYALAKQLNKEWDQKALEMALSPESLSMAADSFLDGLQSSRRAIGKALRISRSAAA